MNCSLPGSHITKDENKDQQSVNPDSSVVVENVTFSGANNAYHFSVTLKSPDQDCKQYADWWEVIDPTGNLIYRKTLAHSHVNEQPFIRSGSPIVIVESDSIIIRGHMNNLGYGRLAMIGSVESGFGTITLDEDFATSLDTLLPIPPKCAF